MMVLVSSLASMKSFAISEKLYWLQRDCEKLEGLLVKLVIIGLFFCSHVRNCPGVTFFVHIAILIGEIK